MEARARSLMARTRGQVITPEHPEYDSARAIFNAMPDPHPRLIFQPNDLDDLVAGVRWASETDVAIAVRGGGHSVAGHSMPADGFVIDLSRWRSASVDPERRIADVEGGCRLMDLDVATAGHGLAAPSGTFLDTGVAGLTLGGGISHIIASEGFACDALVGAQLVTADGRVVEVDESCEPELLWALRGGGGNFGIITRLRYRLTAVRQVYSGYLTYRGDALPDIMASLFELDREAPDELVMQGVAWSEDGTPCLKVNVAWRGEPESGDAIIRDLREHPALVEANLRRMSWLELQARFTPIPFRAPPLLEGPPGARGLARPRRGRHRCCRGFGRRQLRARGAESMVRPIASRPSPRRSVGVERSRTSRRWGSGGTPPRMPPG